MAKNLHPFNKKGTLQKVFHIIRGHDIQTVTKFIDDNKNVTTSRISVNIMTLKTLRFKCNDLIDCEKSYN